MSHPHTNKAIPTNRHLKYNRVRSEAHVNFSVVMVTGGHRAETSVELLSTDGTRLCSLPDLPAVRASHSQTGLITCGGYRAGSLSCVTFSAGRWKKTHTLRHTRHFHTAWASPRGVLLMGGGIRWRTTTELLTDNGDTTPFFNLTIGKR